MKLCLFSFYLDYSTLKVAYKYIFFEKHLKLKFQNASMSKSIKVFMSAGIFENDPTKSSRPNVLDNFNCLSKIIVKNGFHQIK